jgi:hypothetical protein
MPRGSKASYTGKQKRQADHIEESYESRGVKPKEAKRRAWATVNKTSHGGKRAAQAGEKRSRMHRFAKAVVKAARLARPRLKPPIGRTSFKLQFANR